MNYRHAFHAGNFADVFKHVLLLRILTYLKRKPAPFRYIDTHAGIGSYDLAGDEATRTGEWRDGIARLLDADIPSGIEPLLDPYLAIVREWLASGGSGGHKPRYPGSPSLAQAALRPLDRLIFCELHPADVRALSRHTGRDKRTKIIAIDGYTGLRAYVPPVERRGLVLIDPPFEKTDEFAQIARSLGEAWRKWPTGIYCVWYPVKSLRDCDGFFDALCDNGIQKITRVEFAVRGPEPGAGLASNGLAIVNPPYVLEDEVHRILPFLQDVLQQGPGAGWRIEHYAYTDA
ncbi:MAG: 23S rRNA (adenine(2030)-N(6))-methyltransferase RlmJ [Hyphomicrobiales bacterium]|nr:23S rRNA (adenine(2030)-N(6))-methyltransferase RlmJ [Hyphomicrobiales bacterium]